MLDLTKREKLDLTKRDESGRIIAPQWIVDAWIKDKTRIDVRELKPVGDEKENSEWYECPCGCGNLAYRPRIIEWQTFVGMADILTCFRTDGSVRQWFIVTDVAGIIRGEEQRYLDLLNRADPICTKAFRKRGVSEETYAFLKDTHGIDREIAEGFATHFLSAAAAV